MSMSTARPRWNRRRSTGALWAPVNTRDGVWTERETRVPCRGRFSPCCRRVGGEEQIPFRQDKQNRSDWSGRWGIDGLQAFPLPLENGCAEKVRAWRDQVLRQGARHLFGHRSQARMFIEPRFASGRYAAAPFSLLNSAKVFPCSANCFNNGAGVQSSPCCC